VVALAAAATNGCTLIGLGVGALIDRGREPTTALRGSEMLRLKPGDKVKLVLRDGSERQGKLGGIAPVSPEYGERYAAARQSADGPALPAIGQNVEIVTTKGKTEAAVLRGFDPGQVLFRTEKIASRSIPFTDVSEIRFEGRRLDQDALVAGMFAGQLPFQSRLLLNGETIPIESVASVSVPRGSAALKGALIGAVVDAIVLAAAASSYNDSWSSSSTNTTSCPIVYAWDGRAYHREAEMYGGAILPSLARLDRAALRHLSPVDGRLRLRVSNEQGEIESLDAVGLVEAEVPAGASVASTPEGGLALLADPAEPISARDRLGRSVRETLAREDGEEWASDPFEPDLGREGPRDAIVIEFARPAGAREARLAFRLRTSAWGAGLLADLLRLQGREVHSFYARLEGHRAERDRFLAALAREGLPKVEVDEGAGYRSLGFLRNLGPIPRDEGVEVPLSDSSSSTLRVRLSATAGMWRVDRAAADFGPERPLRWRPLLLVSARTHTGDTVTRTLLRADGQVHVMPPWSAAVDLEFEPGAGAGGRTVFAVEATGHYRILVTSRDAPQRALFDRLVAEPGAFGRYALGNLRRDALRVASSLTPPAP
jgi:hypothetical protein